MSRASSSEADAALAVLHDGADAHRALVTYLEPLLADFGAWFAERRPRLTDAQAERWPGRRGVPVDELWRVNWKDPDTLQACRWSWHAYVGGYLVTVPEGAYGPELGRIIAAAASAMGTDLFRWMQDRRAMSFPDPRLPEVGSPAWHALKVSAFRQHNLGAMLDDAVVSTAAGLGALAVAKVSGYERNPLGLLAAIHQARLLEKLGLRLPEASIVPVTEMHLTFRPPVLVPTGDGGVDLDPQFTAAINREKQRHRDWAAQQSRRTLALRGEFQTTRGCPGAIGEAIHTLSGIMLRRMWELAPREMRETARRPPIADRQPLREIG